MRPILGNRRAPRLFFCALGLLLFSWPFGLDPSGQSLPALFFFYLTCWALFIALLALVAVAILRAEDRERLPPGE